MTPGVAKSTKHVDDRVAGWKLWSEVDRFGTAGSDMFRLGCDSKGSWYDTIWGMVWFNIDPCWRDC